jgi:SdrD B-like domain/Secretion system C-terminal sorting domain
MKKILILITHFIMLSSVLSFSQVCIDIDNSSVSSSILYTDGRQLHTLELDLIHDGSTAIDFTASCTNGTILGPSTGNLSPNTSTAVTIEVLIDANAVEANISFTITSGQTNSCPNNVYVIPVPIVDVCLDITQANEVNCYEDNDGVGYDGEVHVYDITYFNNSPGRIIFDLASDNFIIPYNRQSLDAYESSTITYTIYVDPNNRTGTLTNLIQGQHLSNGCASPVALTFSQCNQQVCLQTGAIAFDGCTGPDANGDYIYTYNLEVQNLSNVPLAYNVISPTGSFTVGGTNQIIQANSTQIISFDYKPSSSAATQWSYELQLITANTTNQCIALNTLALPSCATQYGNLQILVYYDQNNNGTKEINEATLSDVNCTIQSQSGGQLYSGTTNAAGQVLFTGLTPGLYLVNEEVNFPWTVNPSGGALNNVLVEASQTTVIEFANVHPNAALSPIAVFNLEGTCMPDGTAIDSSFIYSGFISTSFFEPSMLSIIELNGGDVSNIAVGQVPSLAQAVPFSFQYRGSHAPCFQFRLSTPLTIARDTFCVPLPICCSQDTTLINTSMSISIDHGAFLPVGNNGIRIAEVSVSNIPECTDSIEISNPNNTLLFNGIYVIDGDTILVSNATMPFTFQLPSQSKNLRFYIDENTGSGLVIFKAYGCGAVKNDSIFVGNNFGTNSATLVQASPTFNKVYGASFTINTSANAKPKYITIGLPNFSSDTKFLGATGGGYFYFNDDANLAAIANLRNDNAHIHFVLDDYSANDGKSFNVFYTGSSKAIDVSYTMYAADGTKLGSGSITLDGDKVVSKVNEASQAVDALTLYPLPATNALNIKYGNEAIYYDYAIFNENGQLQSHGKCLNLDTIDISSLVSGIYTLEIKNVSKERQQIGKFVKI